MRYETNPRWRQGYSDKLWLTGEEIEKLRQGWTIVAGAIQIKRDGEMGEFDAGFRFIAIQVTVVAIILLALAFGLGAWLW